MIIKNIYDRNFDKFQNKTDFELVRVNDNILVGEDKNKNPVFVIFSNEKLRDGIAQKTKKLSFECNIDINYEENGNIFTEQCHIIKCYSREKKEIDLFFELCESLFFHNSNITIEYIVDVFSILKDFFNKKSILTRQAAQGLYAELYTILFYKDYFDFAKCWQVKDKMKFDFSINTNIKLEIKSTLKKERVHRFKHDQILNSDLEIYVLSYKFLEDNDGVSLKNLLEQVIPLFNSFPKKQSRLLHILYSRENEDILNSTKYLENYTIDHMRFMDSKSIPKVDDRTPDNVSDIEYSSNCEGVEFINSDELLSKFKKYN